MQKLDKTVIIAHLFCFDFRDENTEQLFWKTTQETHRSKCFMIKLDFVEIANYQAISEL